MRVASQNRHLPSVPGLDDTVSDEELSGENEGLSLNFASWVSCTGSPLGSILTYTSPGPKKELLPRMKASIRPSEDKAGYTAASVKNVSCCHSLLGRRPPWSGTVQPECSRSRGEDEKDRRKQVVELADRAFRWRRRLCVRRIGAFALCSIERCALRVVSAAVPFQPFQVRAQIGCMLVAQIRIFLQSFVDHTFQLRGYIGIQANRSNRLAVQDGFADHR